MRKNLLWAVFLVGFTSILGQVLLMRELVTIFYGNELIYGLVLALWLLMVAVGSLISGGLVDRFKNKTITFIITQVLIIFILPAQIYFGRVIKPWLGIPQGAMVDLPTTFWIIFLTLAPLTLILGFQFVLGSKLLSEKLKDTPQEIGEVYIFESIGSLIGGFLFSFIFVYFLSPFQIVGLIILLLAFSAFLLSSPPAGRAGRKEIFLLLLVGLFFIFSNYLENLSSQKLWSGFKLIASLDSPYGRLAVTEDKGEHTFYENGVILFSTADKPLAEELVHLTFLEHKDPKKVLLIGGGAGNVLDEALKYKIERVDYLELDPKVISFARKYLKSESLKSLNDPKVKIYNLDGRYFLNQSSQDYDIILINLPDPSTALLNRFYTLEFFKECKEKLKKDGLLSIHLSTSETYLGRELLNLNANILKTLRQVFPSVEIIPGGYNYFFASKTKNLVTTNKYTLLRRWRNRGIKTAYFNEYALKFLFLPLRIDTVLKAIEPTSLTRINYDFHPISYFYNLLLWSSELKSVLKDILQNLERIKFSHVLTLLLALVFLIKWLSFYSPRGRGLIIPTIVLFVGFTGMTAQIFLIYGFQSLYGYIYHSI